MNGSAICSQLSDLTSVADGEGADAEAWRPFLPSSSCLLTVCSNAHVCLILHADYMSPLSLCVFFLYSTSSAGL